MDMTWGHEPASEFQSLIGRLKTELRSLEAEKKDMFQSLIGRLKTEA